jgi:hypothetical protein
VEKVRLSRGKRHMVVVTGRMDVLSDFPSNKITFLTLSSYELASKYI